MNRTVSTNGNRDARLIGLALTTALAGVTLTGCAASAPPANLSASKAEAALAKGNYDTAIQHAESAVRADPRNAHFRMTLGSAYLEKGRFASAATSFDDAMKLGDTSPRTALSLALALAGDGRGAEAIAVLRDWEGDIAASDLGLAYSLAGQPERGIHVLSNAVRNGENTAKVRQNLAYSYALAGRWREARLMAQQDIGNEKVGDRMAEWAASIHPDAYRVRVAMLLQVVPDMKDAGQPVELALANFPTAEQLAGEAAVAPTMAQPAAAPAAPQVALNDAPQTSYELPPIGDAPEPAFSAPAYKAPNPQRVNDFQAAFPASGASRVALDTQSFAKPAPKASARPAPKAVPAKAASAKGASRIVKASEGTHLVQLGSFTSEQGARRAWGIYVKRYPELAGHEMVLTQAKVNGKAYWRVAAGGYSAASSRSMCGKIGKAGGEGCIAYAQNQPLPGTVQNERRLASR
ncbi:tetratricopeptide repeat protein [Altererythrobacter sp. CC-YST694]|uniref:SPOR domain-containing protein n=1 Tax=Altererythrobacter sp. CC-YST694 TaxID=2755038 RepID=UPI001D0222E1|nr:SPOR domain-containing protein [Altererythrobacter sp. CC-YST694]MCB5426165.1 tetratricopeptide repeat protein [Altererythrobacter sp. CC-YST694]